MDPLKTSSWQWELLSLTLLALAIIGAITIGYAVADLVGPFLTRVCP